MYLKSGSASSSALTDGFGAARALAPRRRGQLRLRIAAAPSISSDLGPAALATTFTDAKYESHDLPGTKRVSWPAQAELDRPDTRLAAPRRLGLPHEAA